MAMLNDIRSSLDPTLAPNATFRMVIYYNLVPSPRQAWCSLSFKLGTVVSNQSIATSYLALAHYI